MQELSGHGEWNLRLIEMNVAQRDLFLIRTIRVSDNVVSPYVLQVVHKLGSGRICPHVWLGSNNAEQQNFYCRLAGSALEGWAVSDV